ncbi:hypothetical protein BDW22DRAFT_1362920 [Trametopsis cervina]|nr:hypothetical protein BDW22DRAFT_1362920 [Trametopsis cervina]
MSLLIYLIAVDIPPLREGSDQASGALIAWLLMSPTTSALIQTHILFLTLLFSESLERRLIFIMPTDCSRHHPAYPPKIPTTTRLSRPQYLPSKIYAMQPFRSPPRSSYGCLLATRKQA